MNQKFSLLFANKITIVSVIIAVPLLVGSAILYRFHLQVFSSLGFMPETGAKIYSLTQSDDLEPLIEQASLANFVLLGEASHGTSEYYLWRAEISRRLISDHGFYVIAVEGDWEAIYRLNLYIHQAEDQPRSAREIMAGFDRWPTWMWANEEFLSFVEWLREYNVTQTPVRRVSLYGKDIYGAHPSMLAVIDYLQNYQADLAEQAEELYACWLKYEQDFSAYLYDLTSFGHSCQTNVAAVALFFDQELSDYYENDHNDHNQRQKYFFARQNARLVAYAEEHYRQNLGLGPEAWNTRVRGMKDIINNLLDFHEPNNKMIVWAHNTHIGDARATSMSEAGLINIGQLLREKYGPEQVFSVGFGSYRGTLKAGLSWGDEARTIIMPPAQVGSWEDILARQSDQDFFILFKRDHVPAFLKTAVGHRVKGVVYNPAHDERQYVLTKPAERYDAFIFFQRTQALWPL